MKPQKLRIAITSTFPEKACGISKYNKYLIASLKDNKLISKVDNYKFSNKSLTTESMDIDIANSEDFIGLIHKLKSNYDVVHVNYDIGLFNDGEFPIINYLNFLSLMYNLNLPITITLHSSPIIPKEKKLMISLKKSILTPAFL